jgi:hypothetical protein
MADHPTNWRDTQETDPTALTTSPADVVTATVWLEELYFVNTSASDVVVTVSDKAESPAALYKDTVAANSASGARIGPWKATDGLSWVASATGVTARAKYKRIN